MARKSSFDSSGIAFGTGLALVGLLLQTTIGPIAWDMIAAPLNILLGVLFVAILITCYLLRDKLYPVRWNMTTHAAVPAIGIAAMLTIILGLGNWSSMLSHWSFVLVYCWMLFIIGLVTIRRICNFGRGGHWVRDTAFVLNHLGLFLALTCGTLGNADMQRLRMTVEVGKPEWRAIDQETHKIHETGLTIELHSFTIDEYAPVQLIIDNETGNEIPADEAGWSVEVLETLEYAACVTSDSIGTHFTEWHSMGAATAQYVRAVQVNGQMSQKAEGWISCGSFMFPYTPLQLDDRHTLVMPEREPKRYASEVTVCTKDGEHTDATIEVNHPLEFNGWKVYQMGYNETMGRWSDISIFELVRDPWLPFVYLGIYMMLIGALFTFMTAGKK